MSDRKFNPLMLLWTTIVVAVTAVVVASCGDSEVQDDIHRNGLSEESADDQIAAELARKKSTEIQLLWLKDGIWRFSANFPGQGVVPDRWPSGAVGGFDTLPEDLDYPAGPDELLDRSSQYLAFWLGHHLLVWRTENRGEGPVSKQFDPAMPGLAKEHFRVLDEDLASPERDRIVRDLLAGFRDPGVPIVIGEAGEDAEPKEVGVWDFDPANAGGPAADIRLLVGKIVIVDAWDRPIRYKVARDLSGRPTRFLLASAGSDGKWDTTDDIKLRFPHTGS